MGATWDLAKASYDLFEGDLPESVGLAARRSLLNVLGTAIGASRTAETDLLVAHYAEHGGPPASPLLGRTEHLDHLAAVVVNGFAAHLDDFDDTHLATVLHPGASAMSATLAVGHEVGATGERALAAFALGCEVQLRVGLAMSPEHYQDGWHITGTCAPIGAAVTAGLLLGLTSEGLANAVGLAASQTLGHREAFGTMAKPFHPGKGAANGVHAAFLAADGFTAPTDALEDPRGYYAVLSPNGHRPEEVVRDLGSHWELEANTFKPYPCGIVSHPVIDAAILLADRIDDLQGIREIVARVNPLVVDLTGNTSPRDGLEARFSTAHGIAVGLVDGRAGLKQYRDARVAADDVTQLRQRVRFDVDDQVSRAEAFVRVVDAAGEAHEVHVPDARGSRARPLTDDEVESKVRDLVEPVLGGATTNLVQAVADLKVAPSLEELLTAARPQEVSV